MKRSVQFGLPLALTTVSCLCIVLGMWNWYGWNGVWLALPHVAMIAVVYNLWRLRKRTTAIASAVTYGVLWLATAAYGIPHAIADAAHRQDIHLTKSRRIPHRPLGLESQMDGNRHLRPWKSVGNPTVPCPFVVTIDAAFDNGGLNGGGGRHFLFVLPGRSWYFGYNFYWSS